MGKNLDSSEDMKYNQGPLTAPEEFSKTIESLHCCISEENRKEFERGQKEIENLYKKKYSILQTLKKIELFSF